MISNFPKEEIFSDFAGRKHTFKYAYRHIEEINMYSVYAKEECEKKYDGYEFTSFKNNISNALGDLRKKIKKTSFNKI